MRPTRARSTHRDRRAIPIIRCKPKSRSSPDRHPRARYITYSRSGNSLGEPSGGACAASTAPQRQPRKHQRGDDEDRDLDQKNPLHAPRREIDERPWCDKRQHARPQDRHKRIVRRGMRQHADDLPATMGLRLVNSGGDGGAILLSQLHHQPPDAPPPPDEPPPPENPPPKPPPENPPPPQPDEPQ